MYQKHQCVHSIQDLTHKGWIKRRVGFGIFGGWKRQFLSLWRNTILYFHRDDASSREFYNGTKSKNNAKGEINLRNIVGVCEASKGKIPGIVVESNWCHHQERSRRYAQRAIAMCLWVG